MSGTSNNILLWITYQIVVELTAIIFFAIPHNLMWIVSDICKVVIIFHIVMQPFLSHSQDLPPVPVLVGLSIICFILFFLCLSLHSSYCPLLETPYWATLVLFWGIIIGLLLCLQSLLLICMFSNADADLSAIAKSTKAPALALPACSGRYNCLWTLLPSHYSRSWLWLSLVPVTK